MSSSGPNLWQLAKRRSTVVRSTKVALVVGTLLASINHYDMLLSCDFEMRRVLQLLVTYVVPYGVATYGAVMEAARVQS